MKKFAAHYVFSGPEKLQAKRVVCLDDSGCVLSIQPFEEETAATVFLNGVLCPAFSLPGNDKILSIEEALDLLKRIWLNNPLLPINELLAYCTSGNGLKTGSRGPLWCIENIDFRKLLLQENSTVYSVFP